MEDSTRLPELLLLFIAALLLVVLLRWKKKTAGSGLVLAYLFNLWLNYWVAPALYILPWYRGYFDARLVEKGFEQAVYGVLAFSVGSLAFAPFIMDLGIFSRARTAYEPDATLPKAYLVAGISFFFLLSTTIGRLPTARAVISTGQELIVVGLGLQCWQAWRRGDFKKFALWLGITLSLPFLSIVTGGYLGYGAIAAVSVLIFASSFVRSRPAVVLTALVLGYLGLSIYVTYMRDRTEIRHTVWGGEPLVARVGRVGQTIGAFEWFDPFNVEQLNRIDDRMNQSFLVGAAVSRLSDNGDYANGETLWQATLALIPRILWPEKSIVAGSGTVVSHYTGIEFNSDTSVGIGPVMEFYINFGAGGVIVGFLVMGTIVTILDLQASERLAKQDLHGFVMWYLPGMSLLQIQGSLVEVTTGAAASVFVALLANRYLDRLQNKRGPGATVSRSAVVHAGLVPTKSR